MNKFLIVYTAVVVTGIAAALVYAAKKVDDTVAEAERTVNPILKIFGGF